MLRKQNEGGQAVFCMFAERSAGVDTDKWNVLLKVSEGWVKTSVCGRAIEWTGAVNEAAL